MGNGASSSTLHSTLTSSLSGMQAGTKLMMSVVEIYHQLTLGVQLGNLAMNSAITSEAPIRLPLQNCVGLQGPSLLDRSIVL
jgi:hypothetical protein